MQLEVTHFFKLHTVVNDFSILYSVLDDQIWTQVEFDCGTDGRTPKVMWIVEGENKLHLFILNEFLTCFVVSNIIQRLFFFFFLRLPNATRSPVHFDRSQKITR